MTSKDYSKRFEVIRPDGVVDVVDSNFAFVNGETEVMAFYAPGGWHSYKLAGPA